MKKITFLLLMLVCGIGFSQNVLITGYVDATCPGAEGRTVEIYVDGTVDLTGYSIVKQSNGNGFTSSSDISDLGTLTDEFAYITNATEFFEQEFPSLNTTNVIENGSISDNGDDAFQITDAEGNVVDRFGVDGMDGTDQPWEHTDSYYYRNDGDNPNAGNFDIANWTIAPNNSLDDLGTCNNADAFETVVPFGSFMPNASEDPQLSVTSPFANQEFSPNTDEVTVSFSVSNFELSSDEDSNNGEGYLHYTLEADDNTVVSGNLFNEDDFTLTGLSTNDYELTLSLLTNDGNALSPEVTQTVQFSILDAQEVTSIAELRSGNVGDVYILTNEAILTHQFDFRNSKYIEDESAAILIDDPNGVITTSYNRNDGITGLTGELSEYNGTLQFRPMADPGEPTSTGNAMTPQLVTVDDLNTTPADYESELVVLESAQLSNEDISTFEVDTLYDITTQDGNYTFRTDFFSADYIGSQLPASAGNIAGIITRNDSDGDGTAEFYLTSRDSDDLNINLSNDIFNREDMFNIYPNPTASGKIYLNMAREAKAQVSIYNMLGQKVLSKTIQSSKKALDVSALSSGVYLIKLNRGTLSSTRKLVIN